MIRGSNWKIVQKFQDRGVFDVPEVEQIEMKNDISSNDNDGDQLDEIVEVVSVQDNDVNQLHRDDVEPHCIDIATFSQQAREDIA